MNITSTLEAQKRLLGATTPIGDPGHGDKTWRPPGDVGISDPPDPKAPDVDPDSSDADEDRDPDAPVDPDDPDAVEDPDDEDDDGEVRTARTRVADRTLRVTLRELTRL